MKGDRRVTREPQQDDLDALFAEARAVPPAQGSDLMARVMADALAVDAARRRPHVAQLRTPGWRILRALRAFAATFGGAGPVTGMATAAAAGLWIGFAAPAPVAAFAPMLLGQETAADVDLIPDILVLLDPAAEM
jgi:hypothetical protein